MRRRLALILLAAAFGTLFLFPAFSAQLTDWWWFREIGYQVVFILELTTRVLLFLAAGGLTAGVLYLNLRAGQRRRPSGIVARLLHDHFEQLDRLDPRTLQNAKGRRRLLRKPCALNRST